MTGIQNLKREKILRTLQHMGWVIVREGIGHTILKNPGYADVQLTVPRHRVIAPGTVRAMLKEINVSLEDFLKAYNT